MRVTQKDIARKLNLSQSLITGVLNGTPGIWASEETRQRILQTARDFDYLPNAAARALRRGKTNTVACVFFGTAGHAAVVETLAEHLSEAGYDLLVKVILKPEHATERIRTLTLGGLCDAVVLWGLENDVAPTARQLADAGFPFVVKGRFEIEAPLWMQVDFDHEQMMAQAVGRLAEQGHRRIAYFGYNSQHVYTQKLSDGYRSAVETRLGQPIREEFIGHIGAGMSDPEKKLTEWHRLPESERPTAIAIGTGLGTWLGIERWLAVRGMRIGYEPGEIAVAGIAGNETPLLFGEGEAYLNVELLSLAEAMAKRILIPLLSSRMPEQSVVRVLPTLKKLDSMRLPLCQKSLVSSKVQR